MTDYDKGGWIQPPVPVHATLANGERILTAEQTATLAREYMKRYGTPDVP
jgi:hypothetical protein